MNKKQYIQNHIASTPASGKCASNEWLAKNLCSAELDDVMAEMFATLEPVACKEQTERVRESIAKMVSVQMPAEEVCDEPTCIESAPKHSPSWRRSAVWLTSMVAAVALAVLITVGLRPEPIEWTLVRTEAAEQQEVRMPDGSTIWLNGNSEVLYPNRFEGSVRKVYASGEVFADIVKNPKVPFVVDANDVCAKVYGTQFNMKAHSDSRNVEIALVEGAVTMQVGKDEKKIVLSPGDIVRYDREGGEVEKYRFQPFNYATWKDNGNLYFVNMNLGDIAKELEHRFGCTIILGDRSLEDLRYYASFVNNEGVDEILSALNARKTMKITHAGGRIILSKR